MMFHFLHLHLVLVVFFFTTAAVAMDTVRATRDGENLTLKGRVTAESSAGHVFIQTQDGQCFLLESAEIRSQESDDTPFVPFTIDQMKTQLAEEFAPLGRQFGTPFHVLPTKHYLLVYNTSVSYAQWTGMVLETLYQSYWNNLKKAGFPVKESEFPMVVLLFSHRKAFEFYAKKELKSDVPTALLAYYHKWTNRVVICDLSGEELWRQGVGGNIDRKTVDMFLSRPGVKVNMATILHEAVHQISFNCGVQNRFSGTPLWVSEGLALLFETPTIAAGLGNSTGIQLNTERLRHLLGYLNSDPTDPVRALIQSDKPLTAGTSKTVADAYSLAWGLAFYLNIRRPKPWVAYLKYVGEKEDFSMDTPDQRMADFEKFFGSDWTQMYRDMGIFFRQLR